jgi:hypothetical protein
VRPPAPSLEAGLLSQLQSRDHPDNKPEVFRSPGSIILSWAWFVVAVIILVDLAVQGRDHVAVVTAAAVLVVTGIVYACAYRPKIVADPFGISLINPVRDHRVPWAAVKSAVDRFSASFADSGISPYLGAPGGGVPGGGCIDRERGISRPRG